MEVIPFPPLEGMYLWASIAASLAIGAVMLTRGERIHRIALTLVGLAVGYVCGGYLAEKFAMTPIIGQTAGALTVGILALIGARIIWAVLAASMATAAGVCAIGSRYGSATDEASKAATSSAPADMAQWASDLWDQVLGNLSQAWDDEKAMLLMILVPAATVPLLVGLLRPRLARIVMTSLLGAIGLATGVLGVNADWWSWAMGRMEVLGVAVGLLVIVGMAIQYRSALKTDREDDEAPASTKKSDDDSLPWADSEDEEALAKHGDISDQDEDEDEDEEKHSPQE